MSVTLRERELKTKTGTKTGRVKLYLDIYHNGKRYYENLKLYYTKKTPAELKRTILAAANKRKTEIEMELINNDFGLQQVKRKNGSFIKYFENVTQLKKDAKKGYFSYRSTLLKLKAFAQDKDISFREVDEDFIERFKIYLLEKVKVNTVNTYLNKFSAVLYKAVREKIISYNPTAGLKRPQKEEKERIYLTEDELQKLITTPCEKIDVKRAFLFSCFTGLRISDIQKLTWSEIRDDKIYFMQKKTGGFEYLPLSGTAKNILYNSNSSNIIPLPIGKVFNLSSKGRVNMALRLWTMKAEIKKHITFHASRHTFATLALTKGADLYTVSKLLGHKDISTTQIYAQIVDQKLNEAMQLLPVFNVS